MAVRLALLLAVFAAGAWAQASGLLPGVARFLPDIVYLSRQHLWLVGVSGLIAVALAVPLGILLSRPGMRLLAGPVIQLGALGTTVPTLAVLALAMTVLGIGTAPALLGLVLRTMLPVLLNTIAGLRDVAPHLKEAARGMGMTGMQVLLQVELPNAALVILAGVRTALAINVGTVPLAFLIGGGGLGELIFTGIDLMDPAMLLAGALACAVLALLVDAAAAFAQFALVPRGINPLRFPVQARGAT